MLESKLKLTIKNTGTNLESLQRDIGLLYEHINSQGQCPQVIGKIEEDIMKNYNFSENDVEFFLNQYTIWKNNSKKPKLNNISQALFSNPDFDYLI